MIEFGKQLEKNHRVDLYYVDSKRNKKDEAEFTQSFFYKFTPKIWRGRNWKTKIYKDTIELFKLYRLHKHIAQEIEKKQYNLVFLEPSQYTQAPFLLRFLRTKKLYYSQEALRMIYDPLLNSLDLIPMPQRIYEVLNRKVRKFIDKQNIFHADEIFSNSQFSKKNIKKAYGLTSTVCYMGVDTSVFKPVKTLKDIDILYVGAYDYVDGYELFEKALKIFQSKPNIMILARERQWIRDDAHLRDIYNRAKMTVCISYNEPFGLIPLESMACKTPVIAIDEGGYRESVVSGETGILVKKDPHELAKAIKYLLKNDNKRFEMGDLARKHVLENWQWKRGAQMIEDYAAHTK